MSQFRCQGCGLLQAWCCCEAIHAQETSIRFVLLMNEKEPERPTTTSHIILRTLSNSYQVIWHRAEPPKNLIEEINQPDTQAWLLFPDDREPFRKNAQAYHATEGKRSVIIVPDGTWKEARKIVRKSPWLHQLPVLSFSSARETKYDLRRNAHTGQLCTAEALSELLIQSGEAAAGIALNYAFEHFLKHYYLQREHKQIRPSAP